MKTAADRIKRIGIVGNSTKVSCAPAVRQAARLIAGAGRKVCCDAMTARLAHLRTETFSDTATLSRKVDLLLVFGGDGTMLRVAREIAGSRTPMLGINIGGLGFLTAVPSGELRKALQRVWRGEFQFESRSLIQASGSSNGRAIDHAAFNDIVISRGIASRHRTGRLRRWRAPHPVPMRRIDRQLANRLDCVFARGRRRGGIPHRRGARHHSNLSSYAVQPLSDRAAQRQD